MGGATDHALNDLHFNIPTELLHAAFMLNEAVYTHTGLRQILNTSLNEAITSRVIRSKVMRDCDAVGGEEIIIPLYNTQFIKPDNYTIIFRVDKAKTQGRKISAVLSVMYGYPDALYGTPTNAIGAYTPAASAFNRVGAVTNAGYGMLTSYGPAAEIQLSNVAITGENTITIYETQLITEQLTLRCRVTNDEELNNIPQRAWPQFSQLVEFAVKAFIYKQLWIKIDRGQLVGGAELGSFKDMVSEWSDAGANYKDYLRNTWTNVAAYSNKLGKYRAIRRGTAKR